MSFIYILLLPRRKLPAANQPARHMDTHTLLTGNTGGDPWAQSLGGAPSVTIQAQTYGASRLKHYRTIPLQEDPHDLFPNASGQQGMHFPL